MHSKKPQSEKILLGEIQLLLAEKRTYFSLLRTGIATFTLPLSIVVFLGATSEFHNLFSKTTLGVVVNISLLIIAIFGLIVFLVAESRIRKINSNIASIRGLNKRVDGLVI